MKTTNYFLVSLAIVATLFVSCEADDTAEIVINNVDNSVDNSVTNNDNGGGDDTNTPVNIGGEQDENLTLTVGRTYILTSGLIMNSGTTLTIDPGVTVRAASGANVYIAIAQGAKIMAEGTSSQPIVLTSNSATQGAGDWGGLIVLGKAPINSVAGGDATSTSEIGQLPYGGSAVDDNSGVIKYMRVEFGGGAVDGQSENNGFSFYGVGNGTTVEYIQAYVGADDGIEFFGGTVNVRFVAVNGAEDDSIDWTEGYSGAITDAYVVHGVAHDKAFEADGFNTDIGNNSNPLYFSNPTVTNVTVIGRGSGAATTPEAFRLRAGTQGTFTNVLIEGFDEGFDLDGDVGAAPTGQGVLDGTLSVTDVTFVDVTTKLKNDTGFEFTESDFITGDGNGTGTDFAVWGAGWARQ